MIEYVLKNMKRIKNPKKEIKIKIDIKVSIEVC